MNVRVIHKTEELLELKEEWQKLVSVEEPFWKQYDWFYYWWKCRSLKLGLSVFVVQRDSNIIMIAPLVVEQQKARRPVLRFAANDFPNEFIGDVRSALPVLLKYILDSNAFDRLWLRHIRRETTTAEAFQAYGKFGRLLVETSNDSPYVTVAEDWQAYEKSLSSNFKRTLRNKRNRLNKQGRVEFHCYSESGAIEKGLEAAFTAADKSWQADQSSAISSPGQREFFKPFSMEAAEKGNLDLCILTCDDQAIAFEYNLRHGAVVYSLKWGYDASFHAFSPGALLKYEATKQYFHDGYREIDLLGSSDFFKLRWTETIRHDFDYTFFSYGVKNTVQWQLQKSIIPVLKTLKKNSGI